MSRDAMCPKPMFATTRCPKVRVLNRGFYEQPVQFEQLPAHFRFDGTELVRELLNEMDTTVIPGVGRRADSLFKSGRAPRIQAIPIVSPKSVVNRYAG